MAKSFSKKLVDWYQKNQVAHPWRVLWSQTNDPYVVWVSEIMLQQTLIQTVTPKYIAFMKRFPTIFELSKASEDEFLSYVKGMGYYRRFRFMHRAAKFIVSDLNGQFPDSFEDLLSIPGVGHYTASAITSICYNQPTPVLDGNVERVLCRLLDIRKPVNDPKLKKKYPELISKFFDSKDPGDFNQGMMELGQLVCKPKSPLCGHCIVKKHCLAFERDSQSLAPGPKVRKTFKKINCRVEVLKCGTLYGVSKRDSNSKFLVDVDGFANSL